MIQAPDFKEKQILFLDAASMASCELNLRSENILIKEEGKIIEKISTHRLIAIFAFGDMTLTSKLIQKLSRAGASTFFLKRNLETYASICPCAEGNYLLRQKQYDLSSDGILSISRGLVENKLLNQLSLLRSAKIEVIGGRTRINYKKEMQAKIRSAENLASLRGVEGTMGRNYFQAYFLKIGWYKRLPRSKVDENNILLDMGYSFLFHFMDSLLRLYGFDTYKGIYHQLFFQRKSLACDMMEPFRCVIDRSLFKMHTLGQFSKKDFGCRKGQFYLSYKNSGKYAKIFLQEILRYKEDMYQYVRDHYYLILNGEGRVKPFAIR